MDNKQEVFALANPVELIAGKNRRDLTRDDIINIILKKKIERVTFRYTAIDGKIKELKIPVLSRRQMEIVLTDGERVDGSSLFKGMVDTSISDQYVVPEYKTAFLNPFDTGSLDFMCRFIDKDGNRAKFAPDNILHSANNMLKKNTGLNLHALGELEFYLIGNTEHDIYTLGRQKGYHASSPFVKTGPIVNEMINYISQIVGNVKYAHNEVGFLHSVESDFHEINGKMAEQVEIEYMQTNIEAAADNLVLASWIIRNVAYRNGFIASFFPKLDVGHAGSGLHIHTALMKDDENVMTGKKGELSEEAKMLIGGLCRYATSLTAFGNMVSASYLRLVPNQEAPTRVCWSEMNRNALIRVPLAWTSARDLAGEINPDTFTPLNDDSSRQTVELRSPDGSANAHLLMAGITMAAEWGLSNKKDSLALTDACYVTAEASNSLSGANLSELAASCYESAEKLLDNRSIFEREGIFPPFVVSYIADILQHENDRDLNGRLMALPEKERLYQSRRIMHRDVHKH